MIDLLIPVLARPANAQKVADSIHQATVVPHIIVFLATRGDHDEIEACKQTGSAVHLVDPADDSWAKKINAGVEANYGNAEFFFTGADDLVFHPGWDHAAIAAFERTGCPVIGTNDLANGAVMAGLHATHSLVHRSYIEQGTIDEPGKLLHEGYAHQYVDNELIQTAMSRGAFVFAEDSHVEHHHPIWGTAPMDSTYEKGLDNRRAHQDRRLFQTRKRLWTHPRP